MPNEIYPSDHLSLAADLILGGEKWIKYNLKK
jgi:hypothetical protein